MTLARDSVAATQNADTLHEHLPPGPEIEPDSYTYHKLCPATEVVEGVGKPFTVDGT
jgi:hypothetical protein